MGSVCFIETNPKQWTIYNSGKTLKPKYGGEPLYTVKFGEFDDYPEGVTDLEILIRESVLQCILNNKYSVDKESKFKKTLILSDKNGNKIIPIIDGFCY